MIKFEVNYAYFWDAATDEIMWDNSTGSSVLHAAIVKKLLSKASEYNCTYASELATPRVKHYYTCCEEDYLILKLSEPDIIKGE